MLYDVEKGNDLMLTRLTPVATLATTATIHQSMTVVENRKTVSGVVFVAVHCKECERNVLSPLEQPHNVVRATVCRSTPAG